MRIKNFYQYLLLISILSLNACAYINVTVPLDTNLDQTQLGSKVGESYSQSVLWAVAWGDAGTQAAAKNGDITTINHADQKVYSILFGLYSKSTTVVYGE